MSGCWMTLVNGFLKNLDAPQPESEPRRNDALVAGKRRSLRPLNLNLNIEYVT